MLVLGSHTGLIGVKTAYEALIAGTSPLDAVVAGATAVEDDPNETTVGYGGIPNEDGIVELDAAVMDGPTHRGVPRGSEGTATGGGSAPCAITTGSIDRTGVTSNDGGSGSEVGAGVARAMSCRIRSASATTCASGGASISCCTRSS